ncbi:hypothetical protein E2C01_050110 [Portunus trituberculatus]|uniref:Uncharacterized protein n=1 Tax=Portunus trituberculatus TaxID=210409 RepID=A0A5B7GFT4_PORTR|nr:hypothetical protein [Portunus trituberculatus]
MTIEDKEYFLKVTKIPKSIGHHMAEAVFKVVSDAGLEACIQGIMLEPASRFSRETLQRIPNNRVAEVALKAFKHYLRYVSEDSSMKGLQRKKKASMVHNMKREEKGLKLLDGKAFNLNKSLSGSFSSWSRKALDLLLPGQEKELATLLDKSPASWEGDPLFCRMKRTINQVKLTTFKAAITREEAQKQVLFEDGGHGQEGARVIGR